MKKLFRNFVVAFVGVVCINTTLHAFDNLESQQEYLKAVNSEAMRIQPYVMPSNFDAAESMQPVNHNTNVDDMVVRLKKLTAHSTH